MGGAFVNYFNRFGRSGRSTCRPRASTARAPRTSASSTCATTEGDIGAALGAGDACEPTLGPEFTMRFNLYRVRADQRDPRSPGYSSAQAMTALEEVFAETMPREMGYDYMGMSFQEKAAAAGRARQRDLRLLAARSCS